MLRAGPFSDERIVRLVNRRFVPFAFDLFDGALADADAKRFVVERRRELGGQMVSNEPLFVVTPKGQIVGETIEYARTEAVLRLLRKALKDHPALDRPTEEEKRAATPLERARIRIDLLDDEGAQKILAKEKGDEAAYLLGRMARRRGDFDAMERHFARVKDPALEDDLRVEGAYRFRHRYAKLQKHLEGFPKKSDRYAEARYLTGLALFHSGKRKEAQAIWRDLIEKSPQGPWVYRADWAYTSSTKTRRGGAVFAGAGGGGTTPLGRIGYMGMPNPDLTR